jgi:hypothetical protein
MTAALQGLVAQWKLRSESFENALATIDLQENDGSPAMEASRITTQGHQNELKRCIMQLEAAVSFLL